LLGRLARNDEWAFFVPSNKQALRRLGQRVGGGLEAMAEFLPANDIIGETGTLHKHQFVGEGLPVFSFSGLSAFSS
jgi:hypothetical protein